MVICQEACVHVSVWGAKAEWNSLKQLSLSMQIYQVENVCEEEMPDESECARMDRTPTPPTLSPPAIVLGNGEELASEEALSGKNTSKR